MVTIQLDGNSVTVPHVSTSARHYEGYTSAELMTIGVRARGLLDKATGAHARALQVELYTVERELLRRGVVNTYSEKAQEVSNLIFASVSG